MPLKNLAPIDLPGLALPSDKMWRKIFPSADARPLVYVTRVLKRRLRKVQVGCQHWLEVLEQIPLVYTENRVDFTVCRDRDIDYAAIRDCDHSVGTVLRRALEGIDSWRCVGTRVIYVLARCLAVVMARRLDRDNRLWDVVLDWIVACVMKPEKAPARAIGTEFLAQLHLETNWNLKNEFPQLVAKMGDLDDIKKFPIGVKYCLDVAHKELIPTIKPSTPCETQPRLVVSYLLHPDLLEKFLSHLDFASVASLRATCQSARDAVDGLGLCLRLSIGADRKADLWLRGKPHITDLVVTNKLREVKHFRNGEYDAALAGGQIYFSTTTVGYLKRLETANLSNPKPSLKESESSSLRTAFDQMAHEHLQRSKLDLSFSSPRRGADLASGVQWRYVPGILQGPVGKFEVLVEGSVVGSYEGNFDCSLRMKASPSKETVFISFRRQVIENETLSHFLLEAVDVKNRSVTRLAAFDAHHVHHRDMDDVPWQCAGENFVIAQAGDCDSGVFKAFARTGEGEWSLVGEKHAEHSQLRTLLIGDGLAAWNEVTIDPPRHYWDNRQTVVNVLDVRPAALARTLETGGDVFEVSSKIRVLGNYVVRPFERGFFAFEFCNVRKLIKLRVVDLEEVVPATGGWRTLDDGFVELNQQKEEHEDDDGDEEEDDRPGPSNAKKRKKTKNE